MHPQFVADVMRPLKVEDIIDQEVQNLSGGELQRLAMALCLGKPADVYLVSVCPVKVGYNKVAKH